MVPGLDLSAMFPTEKAELCPITDRYDDSFCLLNWMRRVERVLRKAACNCICDYAKAISFGDTASIALTNLQG